MLEQVRVDDVAVSNRILARRTVAGTLWLLEHWVSIFLVLFGLFIFLPFLAPVFMRLGWVGPAQLIYALYSTQCHQMAQRSFFLFGPQPMYNISELPIQMTTNDLSNMLALREFIGSLTMGWKVAWSDRMVYMYGSLWLAAIVFGVLHHRRSVQPLRWHIFGLMLLPMVIDGGTHWLSDTTGGLSGGFRYTNDWLANLTAHALPTWFYVGDALGSFNAWMRLISGVGFGIAVAWLTFPYMERSIQDSISKLREKLAQRTSPMIV